MADSNTISMLNWVQDYNMAGFGTVPSRYINDKQRAVPVEKNWQFITADPLIDTSKYMNFTQFDVILPDWCFVIDVDPRHFGVNDDDWKRLKADFNLQPVIDITFVVKTKRGGFHIYCRKPVNVSIRKSLPGYSGIEFLPLKVTGASSSGKTGSAQSFLYTPVSGEIKSIAEAPSTLIAAITRTPATFESNTDAPVDNTSDIQQYRRFLKSAMPAIEGQNGDRHTFMIAARGKEYNLSVEETFKQMRQHFNPRCDPPWDLDSLRQKVENAYQYTYDNQNTKGITSLFKAEIPPEPDTKTDTKPKPDPMDKFTSPTAPGAKKALKDIKDHIPYTVVIDHVGNDEQKPVKATFRNMVSYFRAMTNLRNLFIKNEFSGEIELSKTVPWASMRSTNLPVLREEDILNIEMYFASNFNIDFAESTIVRAVTFLANTKSYNPVKNYLLSLEWDGKPRLDTMLARHFDAQDSEYTRAVTRKTFTGAVTRVFRPGCQWDYTLVLEGPEGLRKSSFIRVMGGKWVAEFNVDPKTKDTVEMMRGAWLVEMAEMVAARSAESRALMAFLTRRSDRMRLPYARASEDFPRQGIFIGTSNPDQVGYLDPNSENRRYWIVEVFKRLNEEALLAERDQIWAEAYHYYKQGEKLYLDEDLELTARKIAKNRTPEDPWYDPIAHWTQEHYAKGTRLTVATIMETLLGMPLSRATRRDQIRIEAILQTIGFDKQEAESGYKYFIKE
ncbi:MAG: hypothetical protein EOL91_08510 [Actinobacteria bacterium]|nr:hypothetical protein [Actinomycetota bacterium]